MDSVYDKVKKKIIWAVLFVVIAALSIWAVTAQAKNFSLESLYGTMQKASIPLVFCAFLCMLSYIIFEGLAVNRILREFGVKTKFFNGFVYGAADVYFSAITPSATGGQPASAFFMMKDGISGAHITSALLLNLVMYNAAIVVLGIPAILTRLDMFLEFDTLSKVLIIAGSIVLIILIVGFFILVKSVKMFEKIGFSLINLGIKLHIVKHKERAVEKMQHMVDDYGKCAEIASGRKQMLVHIFIFNLLQRGLQIAVSSFVFVATGGSWKHFYDVFIMQTYSVIGSNCIPIPGAMGVADHLMLNGFSMFMSKDEAINLELLSRGMSFYVCILISFLTIIFAYISRSKHDRSL